MPKGVNGNFSKISIRQDVGDNTEIYARVYDDGHIEIVGRNVTLDIKRAGYGKGGTARWAYGENWHVTPQPWKTAAIGVEDEGFNPTEGE